MALKRNNPQRKQIKETLTTMRLSTIAGMFHDLNWFQTNMNLNIAKLLTQASNNHINDVRYP